MRTPDDEIREQLLDEIEVEVKKENFKEEEKSDSNSFLWFTNNKRYKSNY